MSAAITFTCPLTPVEAARAIADALAESYFHDFHRRRKTEAPPFDLEEHRWVVFPADERDRHMLCLGTANDHHLEVLGSRCCYRARYGTPVHLDAVRALLTTRGWTILEER